MYNTIIMQVDENELPIYQSTYDAYSSMKEYCWLNKEKYNVIRQKEFKELTLDLDTKFVYSGSIEYCYYYYKNKISVEQTFTDIPYDFIRREIKFGTKNNISKDTFIKPLEEVKLFTGFVVSDIKLVDFITDYKIKQDTKLLISEKINILDEYRVWFDGNKVVDIRPYFKETDYIPDMQIINKCNNYISKKYNKPFVSDYGIMPDGKTVLIEVNDVHGTGTYGFNGPELWKLLLKSNN